MSKVKVSKDVFEALELNKSRYGNSFPFGFIFDFVRGNDIECKELLYSRVGFEEVINACVNDYELELRPHEKVLREYNDLKFLLNWSIDKKQRESIERSMKAIVTTLNNLEIYIEGVNK